MAQYSNNGKEVEIENLSGEFVFIDPLYLDFITNRFGQIEDQPELNGRDFIKLLEKTFFPYGGGTLIGYKTISNNLQTFRFGLNLMVAVDEEDGEKIEQQAIQKDITTISVDSAAFLILDLKNFKKLVHLIKYDDLIEVAEDNKEYFEKINQQLGNKGWAYVESPGIDSGYDFEGDGYYLIK